jgi:hypothetical protein
MKHRGHLIVFFFEPLELCSGFRVRVAPQTIHGTSLGLEAQFNEFPEA